MRQPCRTRRARRRWSGRLRGLGMGLGLAGLGWRGRACRSLVAEEVRWRGRDGAGLEGGTYRPSLRGGKARGGICRRARGGRRRWRGCLREGGFRNSSSRGIEIGLPDLVFVGLAFFVLA